MMDSVGVYVLTSLFLDAKGAVASKNVGVTFDICEAEAHKAKGVENDFEAFTVPADWRQDAEQSSLIGAMRDFREMIAEMQEAALR
jgi:hypothetical protein